MTKKYLIQAAAEFKAAYGICATDDERKLVTLLAMSMASIFARSNPAFNRTRFLDACGVSA